MAWVWLCGLAVLSIVLILLDFIYGFHSTAVRRVEFFMCLLTAVAFVLVKKQVIGG